MHEADLNPEQKQYNNESNILDSLFEFHPDYFGTLTSSEWALLNSYYFLDSQIPNNVFEYIDQNYEKMNDLKIKSRVLLQKILNDFHIILS